MDKSWVFLPFPFHKINFAVNNTKLVFGFSEKCAWISWSFPVSGFGFGGLNAESMQGVVAGLRSPFTPSQWMELEHQALIYKYITANVSIPSNLLIPIRRALESAGVYGFSSGALRSSTCKLLTFLQGFRSQYRKRIGDTAKYWPILDRIGLYQPICKKIAVSEVQNPTFLTMQILSSDFVYLVWHVDWVAFHLMSSP